MEKWAGRLAAVLDIRFLNNSLREYALCAVTILIGVAIVKLFHRFIIRKLRKWSENTTTQWDDLLVAALESNAVPALYVIIIYHGLRDLALKESLREALRVATVAATTVLAIRVVMVVVKHAIMSYWDRHGGERTESREKNLNGIMTMVKMVVWVLGGILLLDNLGIKVSAFVAGLGITGIAVALAAQTILGDLFSYFVIFFDQPFEIGHTIKVDGFTGAVEHIGLKTTRLRSVDGEQVVISNKFLTDSRVQNFKRMHRRRAAFTFDVVYGTDGALLRAVPDIVKNRLSKFADATFERAHFKLFGESGLRFEVVYFVETPDYKRYMDIQHEVNIGLQEEFDKAGIEFAYPTHVVHVRSEGPSAPSPFLAAPPIAPAASPVPPKATGPSGGSPSAPPAKPGG